MALISFPSWVLVTRSDLSLAHPGQIVLRSVYGAGTQVLSRGPGHWTGRLVIAETDRTSDALRRRVESFLTQLRGLENTFECPIYRPSAGSLAAATALSVTAVAKYNTSDEIEITVSGAAEGLVKGDYVRIGNRLYQLTSDLAEVGCRCDLGTSDLPGPAGLGARGCVEPHAGVQRWLDD